MKFKTDALVVREQHLGESDRLVTLLTRERGLLRAFATGARSVKGRRQAATQLLCYGNFMLNFAKNTYRVLEAEPIQVFFELRGDIEKLTLAQYFCELAETLVPKEETADEYLRLTLNALHLLATGTMSCTQIKAIFELRILTLAGFMPDLTGCAACMQTSPNGMFLDAPEGRILCPQHTNGNALPVPPGVLSAMRHITCADFSRLFYFALPPEGVRELAALCETYLKNQLGRTFTTLDFYHSLGAFA